MSWFGDAIDTVGNAWNSAWDRRGDFEKKMYGHTIFGNETLGPTEEPSIKNDQSYNFQPAFNNAQGESKMELEWEDKQMLAKGGFLNKDEERMYGVKNWKHPMSNFGD